MATLGEKLINVDDGFSFIELNNLIYLAIFLGALYISRFIFMVPFVLFSRQMRAKVAQVNRGQHSHNRADDHDPHDTNEHEKATTTTTTTTSTGVGIAPSRSVEDAIRPPEMHHSEHNASLEFVTFHNFGDHLVKRDNKALAIAYSGYLIAVATVLRSSLFSNTIDAGLVTLQSLIWTSIGLLCLTIAHYTNDRFVLPSMLASGQIVRGENVAVGLVEAGMTVATGLNVSAALAGDGGAWDDSVVSVFSWFAIGQVILVLTIWAYQMLTKYNDQAEIVKGNAAAGLNFGLYLIALGKLVAMPISKSDELVHFALLWGIGTILLFVFRLFVDKLIIPGRSIDREIFEDRNWGTGLVDGVMAFLFTLVLDAMMLSDKVSTLQCRPSILTQG